MLHRLFWLALLGAWSGFVFGTWAWAQSGSTSAAANSHVSVHREIVWPKGSS